MANPFAQDNWDPFGDLPAASKPQTPELVTRPSDSQASTSIRPARAAPPAPKVTSNPFVQLPSSSAATDDPFAFLLAPAPASSSAATTTAPASHPSAAASPQPPSYFEAVDLPPPPTYDAADFMPPPPSYQDAVGHAGAGKQQPVVIPPARAAPPAPAAVLGPLHAGMPGRTAPAAPVPARPAPPAPTRAAPAAPQPARAAPAPPASVATVVSSNVDWPIPNKQEQQAAVQMQLEGMQLSGSLSNSTAISSSYRSTGNVGAVPRGALGSSQQDMQQEVHAQIRLPPLNPKTAAPLKCLSAGLGSLFAGPAGEAGQILQWAPRESGSTLPTGAKANPQEDHDSAECAELIPHRLPAFSDPSSAVSGTGKAGKVSCMMVAPGPGWLWCGTTEGSIYCWSIGHNGGVAKLLHSWVAHTGKVKGIAVTTCGKLYTGSSSGAVKLWSYSHTPVSPPYADPGSPPRLLRQLKKLDSRTGVALIPHSKVIAVQVSTGGRVLWTVGKNTVNLWNAYNGDHLGTFEDGPIDSEFRDSCAIDLRTGLDVERLNDLFACPAAEPADLEASIDSEKDVKSLAMSAAVKGVGKASKVFNRFANKLAAKLLEEGRQSSGESSTPRAAYGSFSSTSTATTAATAGSTEDKTQQWGSIKHLVAAGDGSMWLSYKKGTLEKYSEGGQLLWCSTSSKAAAFKPAGITALAVAGSSVWVGDQAGQIWILDAASGALQHNWKAHVFPVRSIACGGHLVYTLCKAGSIKAWPAQQPSQGSVDAWQADLKKCLQEQRLQVFAGTWNVNETKPSRAGLQMWLKERAQHADLVMIGLQEVEMGTGSVALDVVYQNLAKSRLEAGTQAAQVWATAVGEVLSSAGNFRRVGLRQMSGVLVLVFARAELERHIGEVATASVACGVMGYGGNKGAVAISFSLFRRRLVVVSSHFAAHQDKVEARNADYAKIVRHLHFHNVPTDKPIQQQQYEAADVVVSGSSYSSSPTKSGRQQQPVTSIQDFLTKQQAGQQQVQDYYAEVSAGGPVQARAAGRSAVGTGGSVSVRDTAEEGWGAGVKDAELLVWVGDFNYRVDNPDGFVADRSDPENNPVNNQLHWFVHEKISAQRYLDLLSGDQCSREMAHGRIFHGLAEGPITFMPTYKFEKGRESNKLQPFYDQGEKKRVPAWTDRVFFRGSGPQRSALQANPEDQPADIQVHLAKGEDYNSLMEVNDSDHKPVYAMLKLRLPWYQQQQQRNYSMERLWQIADRASSSDDISPSGSVSLLVEPQQVVLSGAHCPGGMLLSNSSRKSSCLFVVQGCGAGGALPSWLEVTPASGTIPAGGTVRLRVQGSKSHWSVFDGSCDLRVLACLEGSVDSSKWPMASYGYAQTVSVILS